MYKLKSLLAILVISLSFSTFSEELNTNESKSKEVEELSKSFEELIKDAQESLKEEDGPKISEFLTQGQQKTLVLESGNSIVFRGEVTSESVAQAQLELLKLDNTLEEGTPIYLVLDTPGGSVFDSMGLIEMVKGLNRPVHTVTISAASMGFHFVQAFNTRYITSTGKLMAHRASGGGGFLSETRFDGEFESRVKFIKQNLDYLDETTSKRLGLSLETYKSLVVNELWYTGQEAVANKSADEVIILKCGKTLQGEVSKTKNTFFGQTEIIFSKCPLIRVPIRIKSSKQLPNFLPSLKK